MLPSRTWRRDPAAPSGSGSASVDAAAGSGAGSSAGAAVAAGGAAGGSGAGREQQQQCSVCLAEFEDGEAVRTLPCFHSYHAECIDRWLGTHRTCPICKFEIA